MPGTDLLAVPLDPDRTAVLQRRVRLLVGGVLVYNSLEAVTALVAGTIASSTALVAFGLDSIVEVTSALAVTWQFAHHEPDEREQPALRIIAGSFFALAAYVTVDAVTTLSGVRDPEHTTVGIVLTALSLAVMPAASWAERRTGRELGSASVVADSKQTLLCTYLSAIVLGGLLLRSTLGWAWADPLAGLGIAVLAVREGRQALRGDVCCTPASQLVGAEEPAERDDCCEA